MSVLILKQFPYYLMSVKRNNEKGVLHVPVLEQLLPVIVRQVLDKLDDVTVEVAILKVTIYLSPYIFGADAESDLQDVNVSYV